MLQRRISPTGTVYYSSPLLEQIGTPHAFSTRIGGVSSGPFASLNLGNPNGYDQQDPLANIEENYRRLQLAMGRENHRRCYVHQVHGCGVLTADKDFNVHLKADALVTNNPENIVSVRVADCTPILFSKADGSTVGSIHAGWRGCLSGVIQAAIAKLIQLSPTTKPQDLTAAIGPCIGFENFEVGSEVLEEFQKVFGNDAPIRHDPNGKGHVNLPEACRLQLLRAGVLAHRIDTTDRCTYRDKDEFFSHRRDSGLTGRMAALISLK